MITYGIIAALDEEIKLILDAMSEVEAVHIGGVTLYSGKLFGKKLALTRCGVGKVNAALSTSLLITHMCVDNVINVGIAGSLDKGLKPLDVAVSSNAVFHDTDVIMTQYYPYKTSFKANSGLITLCRDVLCRLDVKYKVGRVATGDVFVSDIKLKKDIISRHRPICVEMEGAAVAQAAYCLNKPFLIIRTMSDSADENAGLSYSNLIDKAAENSAQIVLEMVKRGEVKTIVI